MPPKHEPLFFPVFIPTGFQPTDYDADGVDVNYKGQPCPGYNEADGHKPKFGGGFRAPRGPKKVPHHAVDIMAAEGAEVRATRAGRVQFSWTYKGETRPGAGTSAKGGNYVRIVYDDGFVGYYAHMRDLPLVKPGERVVAGQLLGYVGRTGNAVRTDRKGKKTGCPHLHYSLHTSKGRAVDPVPALRKLYSRGGWAPAPGSFAPPP